jgi:uncharacterized protein YndB with AHSA1/START domain
VDRLLSTLESAGYQALPPKRTFYRWSRWPDGAGSGSGTRWRTGTCNHVVSAVAGAGSARLRRRSGEVFEAFVNPDITTKFWFSKGSGRLEVGKQVEWAWEMYNISVPVTAKVIEPNTRTVIEWKGYSARTTVEWMFKALPDGTTFVTITESGFTGDGDSLVKQVADSTQGFSLTLASAKAFLEHKIRLNLIADRYPKGVEEH